MPPVTRNPITKSLSRSTLLLISLGIVVVDQLSKAWVRGHLNPGVSSPFVPGILTLRWVRNTGLTGVNQMPFVKQQIMRQAMGL